MVEDVHITDFQEVIGKFISKMGFEIDSVQQIEEGIVDYKALTSNPMGGRVVSLIRASKYSRLVSQTDVEHLSMRMTDVGAVRGAYITVSGFSDSAIEASRDKPISLINKYQLIDSLEKRGLLSDKELMSSLDNFGMAEKHFQGIEQSFVSLKTLHETKPYFETKAKVNEKIGRITFRHAPVEVFKVTDLKDIWTDDETLRTLEKKDYILVNLNNLDLYYIIKRVKNKVTEHLLMRSEIIRKVHDLPPLSKEHLLHLLDHGDLPIEDLAGKELSILKNNKVIEIYEGKKSGGDLMDYLQMFLDGLLETISIIAQEISSGISSMGEGSSSSTKSEKPLAKKVTAQIVMPHRHGGIYDIWRYVDVMRGFKEDSEIDPMNYSSKEVASLLGSMHGSYVEPEGILFMPYFRARYVDKEAGFVTKYEVLFSPRFKKELMDSKAAKKEDAEMEKGKKVHVQAGGPRIKTKAVHTAGKFKLIK